MNEKYLSLQGLSIFYSRIKEWITQTFAERKHIHNMSEIDGLQEKFDKLSSVPDIETPEDAVARINQLSLAVTNMADVINSMSIVMESLIPSVGELYISTSPENPSSRFGGAWRQIKDTFLLASGDIFVAGSTGGEIEHTLTVDEIPSHAHTYKRHAFDRNDADPDTGEDVYGANNKTLNAHEGTTGYVGGGLAHNNMPPYLSVYVWEKIS